MDMDLVIDNLGDESFLMHFKISSPITFVSVSFASMLEAIFFYPGGVTHASNANYEG
jgi:hypothetical protein